MNADEESKRELKEMRELLEEIKLLLMIAMTCAAFLTLYAIVEAVT